MESSSTYRVQRAHYSADIAEFLEHSPDLILGRLTSQSIHVERPQTNAWLRQIEILKQAASTLHDDGRIFLEYVVPRLGKRIDCVLLLKNVVCVIEFKVGASAFYSADLDQVWDYALDLKNFHEASHRLPIAPILVCTDAPSASIQLQRTSHEDLVLRPLRVNRYQLRDAIEAITGEFQSISPIGVSEWEQGRYSPTPTIVEAARALYAGHNVREISRSDAGAINLARTSQAIDRIIAKSRAEKLKSICFITRVPGAGKTLVGLDIATRHFDKHSATYSVFLSGNGPLVEVLREALSRDLVLRERAQDKSIRKQDARAQVSSFIQNVHHFRDDCLADTRPPVEHVVLFDEAQRAWDETQTQAFMTRKKGHSSFNQSEPEFLISCMDRHDDWATVVCLVGEGQEINTGEAGIGEWIRAIHRRFRTWHIHVPPQLYSQAQQQDFIRQLDELPHVHRAEELHLSVSMRSFRAESLSEFIRQLLDRNPDAKKTLLQLQEKYPIVLSRSVAAAKRWLRAQARGSERYGLLVSSLAMRLKPLAIDVRAKVDPIHWFLGEKDDVRSSYYMEDAATEFQIQGLELDWAGVVWDGDLRFGEDGWRHSEFSGSAWRTIRNPVRQKYLVNAYRVLLTRARQGMVIVVPEGDASDPTRAPQMYDPTYAYLRGLGLPEMGTL
jgi:hypothetical protein